MTTLLGLSLSWRTRTRRLPTLLPLLKPEGTTKLTAVCRLLTRARAHSDKGYAQLDVQALCERAAGLTAILRHGWTAQQAEPLRQAFDGRLGRVTVAMKAEAAQMSASGRFAVAEHAPQRDGRELLKLRDGAAELVIDANRVVDIAYEDRGVLGLTVVVSGRGGAFMLATLDGDDGGARERFFSLAE